jgi:ABC-type microcin C transport system permease subunit YejB
MVTARRTAHKWLPQTGATSAEASRVEPITSPKQLAWTLVLPIKTLPTRAAADLARIRQDAEAARVADLARCFTTLVRAYGIAGRRRIR